jgi:aconitate hydratase
MGTITDPRSLAMPYPHIEEPQRSPFAERAFEEPLPAREARRETLVKGPNIAAIPDTTPLPDRLELPVLLKVGDDISTDEILPAGMRVLPFRSNIPAISRFAFEAVDPTYPDRAHGAGRQGHAIVGGSNYGQGSSREHAALAPRYLGLRVVLAVSFARIHRENLINFGVLPLTFVEPGDYRRLAPDGVLVLSNLHEALARSDSIPVKILGTADLVSVRHDLTARERELLLSGGVIPWARARLSSKSQVERPVHAENLGH